MLVFWATPLVNDHFGCPYGVVDYVINISLPLRLDGDPKYISFGVIPPFYEEFSLLAPVPAPIPRNLFEKGAFSCPVLPHPPAPH